MFYKRYTITFIDGVQVQVASDSENDAIRQALSVNFYFQTYTKDDIIDIYAE